MTRTEKNNLLIGFLVKYYHSSPDQQQMLLGHVQQTISSDAHVLDATELFKELLDTEEPCDYKYDLWLRLMEMTNKIIINNSSSLEQLFAFCAK